MYLIDSKRLSIFTDFYLKYCQLTAEEASDRGLVTEVLPHASLHQIWPRIREYAQLPLKTLVTVKEMMRGNDRKTLVKVSVFVWHHSHKLLYNNIYSDGL